MDKLIVHAEIEKLDKVLDFISNQLKTYNFSKKFEIQLELATEEIFVNIANYAYKKKTLKIMKLLYIRFLMKITQH